MRPPSKAILISGGARGIGRALARYFLLKGHRVYILDIDEPELIHTVSVHLKAYSARLSSSICNLRDVSDIRTHVQKAADFFGGHIDVLISNGAIAHPYWDDGQTMEDPETLTQWQAYVETNLTAPFALSQACIPYMKSRSQAVAEQEATQSAAVGAPAGPCILLVGSFRAVQSDPNQEGYAATKAGQLGLMHSMAVSCKPWGIRVNLIAPGHIKAKHECKEGDERGLQWVDAVDAVDVDSHVTNRPGRPEDIAQAAEYLMEAGFVTGQDLLVDGGATRVKHKRTAS